MTYISRQREYFLYQKTQFKGKEKKTAPQAYYTRLLALVPTEGRTPSSSSTEKHGEVSPFPSFVRCLKNTRRACSSVQPWNSRLPRCVKQEQNAFFFIFIFKKIKFQKYMPNREIFKNGCLSPGRQGACRKSSWRQDLNIKKNYIQVLAPRAH